MPASTGTQLSRCTSHRGVMVTICGADLVAFASCLASTSPSALGSVALATVAPSVVPSARTGRHTHSHHPAVGGPTMLESWFSAVATIAHQMTHGDVRGHPPATSP